MTRTMFTISQFLSIRDKIPKYSVGHGSSFILNRSIPSNNQSQKYLKTLFKMNTMGKTNTTSLNVI